MSRRLRRRIRPEAKAKAMAGQEIEASIAALARRTAQGQPDAGEPWRAVEEDDGLVYFYDEHGRQRAVANAAYWGKALAADGSVPMREVGTVKA